MEVAMLLLLYGLGLIEAKVTGAETFNQITTRSEGGLIGKLHRTWPLDIYSITNYIYKVNFSSMQNIHVTGLLECEHYETQRTSLLLVSIMRHRELPFSLWALWDKEFPFSVTVRIPKNRYFNFLPREEKLKLVLDKADVVTLAKYVTSAFKPVGTNILYCTYNSDY